MQVGAVALEELVRLDRQEDVEVAGRPAAHPRLSLTAEAGMNDGLAFPFVHLALLLLRRQGIAARYVSGYLHPDPSFPIGTTVKGESHAWVEWWDQGWHAFDPTNDSEPGDRYVVVATGRVKKPGRTLTICEFEVLVYKGGQSKTCAFGLQTLMCVQGRADMARPG